MNTRPPPLPGAARSATAEKSSTDWTMWVGLIVGVCLLFLFILFLAALSRQGSKNGSPAQGTKTDGFSDIAVESGVLDQDSGSLSETDTRVKPSEEQHTTTSAKNPSSKSTHAEDDDKKRNIEKDSFAKKFIEIQKFDGMSSNPGAARALEGEGNPFLTAVDSESTIFVVDISPSMAGERSRRVLNALVEAINALNKSQRFLVVLFDSQMHLANPGQGLEQATAVNKATAIHWLRSYSSGAGGTEPLESIVYALAQSPELIIVLSDGEFNPRYVEQVTIENERKPAKCRIDTIGLAEIVVVMRELAKQNGGVYYQAR